MTRYNPEDFGSHDPNAPRAETTGDRVARWIGRMLADVLVFVLLILFARWLNPDNPTQSIAVMGLFIALRAAGKKT